MTFIRPDNHIGLLGLLFACGAFAFWLERVPWAKRPSATLFIFGVPLVLSNRQVIPCQAPVRRSYQDCLSLLSRDGRGCFTGRCATFENKGRSRRLSQ